MTPTRPPGASPAHAYAWICAAFVICPPAVLMAFLDVPRLDRIVFAIAGMLVAVLALVTLLARVHESGVLAGRAEALAEPLTPPGPARRPDVSLAAIEEPPYVGPVPVDPVREGTPGRTPSPQSFT